MDKEVLEKILELGKDLSNKDNEIIFLKSEIEKFKLALEKRGAELEKVNSTCSEGQLNGKVFFMDIEENIIYPISEQKESSKLYEKQLKEIHEAIHILFSDDKEPFDLTGLRVEVGNEENSRKLQEYAFKQGFKWNYLKQTIYKDKCRVLMFWTDNCITHDRKLVKEYKPLSEDKTYKQVHYNDIKHHIEPEQIKTEPIPSDITLKDAISKVYGKKPIGFDKIKLNDFINALNGKTNG